MKLKISPDLVVFILGLLLLTAGLFLIYPPAALVGPGAILIAISIFGDKQ